MSVSPSWMVPASGVMVTEPTPLASSTVETVVDFLPPKVMSLAPAGAAAMSPLTVSVTVVFPS